MDDSKSGVEPDGQARHPAFDLGEPVAELSMAFIGRSARRLPLPERSWDRRPSKVCQWPGILPAVISARAKRTSLAGLSAHAAKYASAAAASVSRHSSIDSATWRASASVVASAPAGWECGSADRLGKRWNGTRLDLLERASGDVRLGETARTRSGKEYRSGGASDYDWFFSLGKAEQARIRENWMTSSRGAPTPTRSKRLPIREWLALTRRVDMARALATGRHVNRDRHGGLDPASLIAGEPCDPRELHHPDRERAHRHVSRAIREGKTGRHHARSAGPHVEFFTDKAGVVHPIRATTGNRRVEMLRGQSSQPAPTGVRRRVLSVPHSHGRQIGRRVATVRPVRGCLGDER